MTRWSVFLALALGAAPAVAAQDSAAVRDPAAAARPAATLTLDEAIQQAKANSPAFRQTLNNAGPAGVAVRSAYGNFLPQADVSSTLSYTGAGDTFLGGGFTTSQSSSTLNSSYSIGLSLQLSGATFTQPAQAKANRQAVYEEIGSAEMQLRTDVTTQYLTALQAGAQVDVARQQVARNQENLDLARARYQVGQATLLDVRRAEVDKGNSDVTLLRAVQSLNEAKLELMRRMGIVSPVPVTELALPDSFPVVEPAFALDQLLTVAEAQNPSLRAFRARQNAAGAAVTAAKSEYLPTLSFRAGWQGFTQEYRNSSVLTQSALASRQANAQNCRFQNDVISRLTEPLPYPNGGVIPDCNAFAGLTPTGDLPSSAADSILSRNNVFPFDFTRQPFQASVTVSLPIFTGFDRSLRISQAKEQALDAEERVRETALQVRTTVEARYLAVQTAYQAIAVQEASQAAAREQLRLAQDRYRLGSGTSLELSDAQAAVARAEGDYVNAVYDYHKAVAALEAAVGRPLR